MRHFETLTEEELKKLGRQGGLTKNPKKGVGSLSKEERSKRGREAARIRWRKHESTHTDEELPKDEA